MKNHRTITLWLLILFSACAAMAFNGDNEDDTYFYLSSYQTFRPGEDVQVNLSGNLYKKRSVTPEFRLYRIKDPISFFNNEKNPHSPGITYDDDGKSTLTINPTDAKRFEKVKTWQETIKAKTNWFNQTIKVPVTTAGVYLLYATIEQKGAATVVIVSDAGLITKQSDDQILAWMVDLRNGQKVSNANLLFRKNDIRKPATTDVNGLAVMDAATFRADDPEKEDGMEMRRWGEGGQLVYGEYNGNFVISDSYYYSYWRGSADGSYKTYVQTDRPVYRPSQTVYYRGILRSVNNDGTYDLPKAEQAAVWIMDSRGGELVKDTVTIDDMGTFHGELLLGDEPPLGDYSMNIMIDGNSVGYFSFAVEEYRKPEYEVTVTTPNQSVTRGETVTATVKASYYFGAPVAEGQVEYRILRSPYYRPWWIGSRWAYLYKTMPIYNPYGSEYVDGGTGKLNPDGTFTFTFKTPTDLDGDFNYTIVANVTDASRRTISGSTSIRVTRGDFYLAVRTDRYVYKPGEKVTLNVNANTFDSDAGVATDFAVSVKRTWWTGKKSKEEVVWTGSGRTGTDGSGMISFDVPKSGYLTAEVTAKDAKGNEITASAGIYVADESYPWNDLTSGAVKIIPDRDLYHAGDTITAMVIMPVENVDMLITVEGPVIFHYDVERIAGNSLVVRIPVTQKMAPNAFIAATALVGSQMYTAQEQVSVTPDGKILTVEVTSDKKEYEPGESGTVTLRALDDKGDPIPDVDLAVSVVDEAIYAIRPDNTPDMAADFYGQRWNQVNTNSSLNFQFYGQGMVAAPQAAMAMEDASGDSMGRGIVGNLTVAGNYKSARMAFDQFDDGALVEPALRQNFRDLMFWTHSVRTDSRGYATIPVDFPDNLTTWRITARGVTRATQVGQGTAKVIATKDLLVRMETPRFITEGDDLVIATNVHNYLDTEKKVTVEFEAKGLKQESKKKTIIVPANGEGRVDWKVSAESIGTAILTASALTDEESDAMEVKIPILPLGAKTGASAITDIEETNGKRDLKLVLPDNGKLESAVLNVSLSPSAASSMLGALDELIGYPYGCVEQTMSRFLPTVVVADVLEDLDVPFDQTKKEELPKMVDAGLKRLYALQHDDGGWGWWEHDENNPFMTAYVLYGLKIASDAGYQVSNDRYNRGLEVLYRMIESRVAGGGLSQADGKLDRTTEAYLVYVASVASISAPENGMVRDRIDDLADDRSINNYGVALLAQAAQLQGMKSVAADLASRLRSKATETGSGAFWKGQSWHYNWQDDEVETSAAVVKALLATDGQTDLVKKGVRWLLAQKEGASWHNTRQTAMVIYSLVDYLRGSNELNPNYTMIVKVNGKEVAREKITREDVFKEEKQIVLQSDQLRKGENVITIEKSGEGRLYASGRLTYFATGKAIEPGAAGFKVVREYYRLNRVQKKGKFVYEKQKITGPIRSGDELFVKLTVTPDASYSYFIMEDPLPAGFEVVTDENGYNIVGESGYSGEEDEPYYRSYWRWNWWFADKDVRDEKVAFFATQIDPKPHELSYIIRAQIPGTYGVMPAVGSLMYYPEVRGNSGTLELTVVD